MPQQEIRANNNALGYAHCSPRLAHGELTCHATLDLAGGGRAGLKIRIQEHLKTRYCSAGVEKQKNLQNEKAVPRREGAAPISLGQPAKPGQRSLGRCLSSSSHLATPSHTSFLPSTHPPSIKRANLRNRTTFIFQPDHGYQEAPHHRLMGRLTAILQLSASPPLPPPPKLARWRCLG